MNTSQVSLYRERMANIGIATDISETSRCRNRLAPFCKGCGIDIGCGGDFITETAIRIDLATPYSLVGPFPAHLTGDGTKLRWFADGCLDYVYSSHLLEDFENTQAVLNEWCRVLRRRGRLILYCPDEKAYRMHCLKTGAGHNTHHKHADFSLAKVKTMLGNMNILHEIPLIDDYSWDLVAEKV